MTAHGPDGTIRVMKHRLVLDIDCSDDAVSGRITGDRGQDVPFEGWLGLAGALEIVTADPASTHDTACGSGASVPG